jgi:carbonic anhydrase
MCSNCNGEGIGRRDFLKFGAGFVAIGFGGTSGRARGSARRRRYPDEALAALKSGNSAMSATRTCSIDLQRSERRRSAPSALGHDHQLRRQSRSAGANLRQPQC